MKLDLDWSIEGAKQRQEFAKRYVAENEANLTKENLNTIAEYVLWADVEHHEELGIQLETERSPWRTSRKEVSIDALFQEAEETGRPVELLLQKEREVPKARNRLERAEVTKQLGALNEAQLYELVKRKEVTSLHGTAAQWVDLWSQIDVLEYEVQFWELERGKRKGDKPIRKELAEFRLQLVAYLKGRTLVSLRKELEEGTKELEPYLFLRKKRLLVSLRQQQYQLLDALPSMGQVMKSASAIDLLPKGILGFYPIEDVKLMVGDIEEGYFEPAFQRRIVKGLRRMDLEEGKGRYPDLKDVNVIRALLERREELEGSKEKLEFEERQVMESLLRYLQYYITRANLSEELKVVLSMKAAGRTNKEVKERLEEEYGLSYMENYVSTIYTKRVLQAIVNEVEAHVRMLEYITMGRNVFKRCVDCKRLFPRNNDFFNKRGSTSDGFLSYCKECKATRKKEREVKKVLESETK